MVINFIAYTKIYTFIINYYRILVIAIELFNIRNKNSNVMQTITVIFNKRMVIKIL